VTDTNNSKLHVRIEHTFPDIHNMFSFNQKMHIESPQYLLYIENQNGKIIARGGINAPGGVHYEGELKDGDHIRLELTAEDGLILTTGNAANISANTSEEM